MTAIVRLLLSGRPPAIARLVIPVVVDALEREAGRTFAHIGEKVLEDTPSVADCDAAAAVVPEDVGFWIEAASFHRSPRAVSPSHAGFAARGVAVFDLSRPLALEASATRCMAARQIVADDDDLGSAIAEAGKAFVLCLGMRKAQDGQAPEALSSDGGGHVGFH